MHDRIEENLLRFLRSYLGDETLDYRVRPRRFAQGMFSDVRCFTLNGGPKGWTTPLVLRMLPFDADPEQPSLETAVHNGLARVGMPAPVVLLSHDGIEVLGRMFMVMEQRPGRPSLKGVRWDVFAESFRSCWSGGLPPWPKLPETSIRAQQARCSTKPRPSGSSRADSRRAPFALRGGSSLAFRWARYDPCPRMAS